MMYVSNLTLKPPLDGWAPSPALACSFANQNIRCPKGSQSLIAEDWTQNFTELGEQLLEKYVFPSLQGDWKDTYDCGQPGIKKVNVKGIAGCLKKKVFHGDIAVEYVCNEQARTRSVVIDGIMQLSGKC